MIKFFRKIRKSLLTENKFSKYFLYALGEIILVVLGILIALQINTWNQKKADYILEEKMLNELNRNLKKDLYEIQSDIIIMDSVQNSCTRIIKHIKSNQLPNKRFYNDISILKIIPHFNPNKSGYGFLQSKGVDIIKNDSLRKSISNHYELNYPYFNKYENERVQFKTNEINPVLLNYFKWVDQTDYSFRGSFQISDKDYLKIKNNGFLERFVLANAWENDLIRSRALRLERQTKSLIQFINQELVLRK
jgi:hypothetical protein